MKEKKAYRLLSKTIFFYLVFTFLAFYGSALFLTKRAEQFINRRIEHRYERAEHFIKHQIERHDDLRKLPKGTELKLLNVLPDISQFPQYSDTLLLNSETDEFQRFRKKTVIIHNNEKYYQLDMIRYFGDFYELKNAIFEALIPAFIILAIVIVLFNYVLSGYFFKPFNRIMEQMGSYEVSKTGDIDEIKTTTSEFKKMQELFGKMINRIESDYKNLKEYTENMAHEIQTPLTVIKNKTENLLTDDKLMETYANDIKIILDETNHLSKLGNTLNLLTKIENGEYCNNEIIHTRDIIERHVESIRESANLKSIQIETNLDNEHTLTLDPFLFDIVIKNLLRNAIRYTEGSPILIYSNSKELSFSNPGSHLNIPHEKLFERFYSYNGTKPSLGLGLSLVHKICELNQIQIKYDYIEGCHIFSLLKRE